MANNNSSEQSTVQARKEKMIKEIVKKIVKKYKLNDLDNKANLIVKKILDLYIERKMRVRENTINSSQTLFTYYDTAKASSTKSLKDKIENETLKREPTDSILEKLKEINIEEEIFGYLIDDYIDDVDDFETFLKGGQLQTINKGDISSRKINGDIPSVFNIDFSINEKNAHIFGLPIARDLIPIIKDFFEGKVISDGTEKIDSDKKENRIKRYKLNESKEKNTNFFDKIQKYIQRVSNLNQIESLAEFRITSCILFNDIQDFITKNENNLNDGQKKDLVNILEILSKTIINIENLKYGDINDHVLFLNSSNFYNIIYDLTTDSNFIKELNNKTSEEEKHNYIITKLKNNYDFHLNNNEYLKKYLKTSKILDEIIEIIKTLNCIDEILEISDFKLDLNDYNNTFNQIKSDIESFNHCIPPSEDFYKKSEIYQYIISKKILSMADITSKNENNSIYFSIRNHINQNFKQYSILSPSIEKYYESHFESDFIDLLICSKDFNKVFNELPKTTIDTKELENFYNTNIDKFPKNAPNILISDLNKALKAKANFKLIENSSFVELFTSIEKAIKDEQPDSIIKTSIKNLENEVKYNIRSANKLAYYLYFTNKMNELNIKYPHLKNSDFKPKMINVEKYFKLPPYNILLRNINHKKMELSTEISFKTLHQKSYPLDEKTLSENDKDIDYIVMIRALFKDDDFIEFMKQRLKNGYPAFNFGKMFSKICIIPEIIPLAFSNVRFRLNVNRNTRGLDNTTEEENSNINEEENTANNEQHTTPKIILDVHINDATLEIKTKTERLEKRIFELNSAKSEENTHALKEGKVVIFCLPLLTKLKEKYNLNQNQYAVKTR